MKKGYAFQYPVATREFIVVRDVITEDGEILQKIIYPPARKAIVIPVGGIK